MPAKARAKPKKVTNMVNTNSRIHGWIVTLAWALLFPVGAAAPGGCSCDYEF